jgi:hypothetical protein
MPNNVLGFYNKMVDYSKPPCAKTIKTITNITVVVIVLHYMILQDEHDSNIDPIID